MESEVGGGFDLFSDSHAHLTLEHFDPDRDAVIARARAAGLVRIITVSSFIGDAEACAALAARHDFIHFTAGVHPHEAKSFTPEAAEGIRRAAALPRAVAIGEIGLDYHYDFSPREAQRRVFRAQIDLARELKLPLVIHTREAWDDTLLILGEARASEIGGVFHCFSGGTAEARRCLDLGFLLSFAGPVTFKNARDVAEAAAFAPLDRVLCETDSPYLTPHPHRGKRNEPANVLLVAAKIAALKGLTPQAVGEATTRNLEAVFRLA
ncbi:MAG TPA: TatD family hydrolase [Candidatus Polarisedimenticolia bacterium]|nr:TatD family hydrolase [Candidatus Polarisedimenticolia bacterium]